MRNKMYICCIYHDISSSLYECSIISVLARNAPLLFEMVLYIMKIKSNT